MNARRWLGTFTLWLAALALSSGPLVASAQEPASVGTLADLYGQMDGAGGGLLRSSGYTTGAMGYTKAADDFTVGGPAWWAVTQVEVAGTQTATTPDEVVVEFYHNATDNPNGPVPGALFSSQAGSVISGFDNGNFIINLSTVVLVPGNVYWIAVQTRSGSLNHEWNWATRTNANGYNSAYITSSVTGCVNVWQPRIPYCDVLVPGNDLLFTLRGTEFVPSNFLYLPSVSKLP